MIKTFSLGSLLGSLALFSCTQLIMLAQPSLPTDERTNGKLVRSAFSEPGKELQLSSAVLYDGARNFGYGIVTSSDGYILVKSSELEGRKNLSVRVGAIKFDEIKIIARNPRWDLTLIKLEAEGLTPVSWAESSDLAQGSWVVANGVSSRRLRRLNVGVISAKARAVEGRAPVVIGVSFKAEKDSLVVQQVTPETGAERSGLLAGDTFKKFGGEVIESRKGLIERVRDYIPGDVVPIEIERAGELLEVEVELMARSDAYEENKSRNDEMSGSYSKRRDSFPRVLQTDIPFSARTIGGPLLNLDGECIGMNIARANRAESFAIPVEELRSELAELMKSAE